MYTLTLTEEQAKVIAEALNLFARVGCGDFREILNHPTMIKKLYKFIDSDKYTFKKAMAIEYLDYAKAEMTGMPPNISEGIPAADEPNRVAYDIFQVIKHRMAWDKSPAGGNTVDFREPMRFSEQPLPKIERE